jgi:hypothetical protein
MTTDITAEALLRAAAILEQIDQLETRFIAILSGTEASPGRRPSVAKPEVPIKRRRKRKMSAAARAKIAAAQRARWARFRTRK